MQLETPVGPNTGGGQQLIEQLNRQRVLSLLDDFAAGDIEAALGHCTDDVDFLTHAPIDILPHMGPRRGKGTKQAPLGSKTARRRSWLQVSMEQNMGCAVGACLGCVIMGTEGPQRVCREGPVFAADEVAWEGWR